MRKEKNYRKLLSTLLGTVAVAAFAFTAAPVGAAQKSHSDTGSHVTGTDHGDDHADSHADHAGGVKSKGKRIRSKGGTTRNGRGGKSLRDIFTDMVDEVDDAHGPDASSHGKKQPQGGKPENKGKGKPQTVTTEADEPDDSDRPAWAGVPGREGKPGQPNTEPGTKKGTLFGDMYVLLRDENGVPILTAEGWVQPVDADGNPLPLDEEGHLVDADAAIEVELGRLNVGRSPLRVLSARYEEAISLINEADSITLDASGRLVLITDGEVKTIDSPLENLAIYVELMNSGTLTGVVDTTKFDGALAALVDGAMTSADLDFAAAFVAAASDKAGSVTVDSIVYINSILNVAGTIADPTGGDLTYVDFADFDYNREDTFGDTTATVLIQDPDTGNWVPTEVNLYEVVFNDTNYISADGGIDGFAQAADDARAVIEYIHEYEVPETVATQ